MKKFFILFKTLLNINFGISALKYRLTREKKKRWEPILIFSAIVFGFAPLIVMYTLMMTGIFMAGNSLANPQPEMVLTLAFLLSQLMILFFGMFYIMGSFYFSQDLETLVPLPLKPYEVMGSKFLVVMVNEYLTALPLLLPPLLIYGIGMGEGVVYWIKCIFMLLAAPVFPLAIGAVFIMLLMRVVNLRKNKDLLAIIGGFAGLILALSVNFFIQRIPKGSSTEFLKNLLESQSGLINEIGSKFPPSIWATFGLSDNGLKGLGYFALFIGAAIALFIFLLWLSNLVFYKALVAGQEVSRKRKAFTNAEISRQYNKETSPVLAILIREWKLLLRTPIYVINGLTGAIIGPFIIVIMFFAQGSNPETKQILVAIMNPAYQVYVILGALGIMLFTAGMNLVASTSVSREGKSFWIAKMIPVSPSRQVLAKLLQGYMVSALGVIVTCIAAGIFARLSLLHILLILFIGLVCSVPLTSLNLILDVFHPKLIWNSEQEAIKQNMNGILGMLVSLLFLAVLAAVTVVLLLTGMPVWTVYAGIVLIAVISGILSLMALFALAERKYIELEA